VEFASEACLDKKCKQNLIIKIMLDISRKNDTIKVQSNVFREKMKNGGTAFYEK
jgi:hypothetical protein